MPYRKNTVPDLDINEEDEMELKEGGQIENANAMYCEQGVRHKKN